MTAFTLSYLIVAGDILLLLLATKKLGNAGKKLLRATAGFLDGVTAIVLAACSLIEAIRKLVKLCKQKGR